MKTFEHSFSIEHGRNGRMGFSRHRRKRLRAIKAESVTVFPNPFFDGFNLRKGVFKNNFFETVSVRVCVHPGAHTSIISRFCITKNDVFQDEKNFVLNTVFALKPVDFVSQKGIGTQNALPSVKVFFL